METAGVRHWLSSLNLPEQYESLLLAAGYDSLSKCGGLNDAILQQIGIKQSGHRKRILLHLPSAKKEADPFASASADSEDDDREIYDIPPVGRKSSIVLTEENMYTNFAEMNEIPRPVLPPKMRLSSDVEVEAKLGIITPPAKPRLSQGDFGLSPCSPDSCRTTKPKLCVVYPEKRPPVPARRISKEGNAPSVSVESLLNNNIEGFDPALVQKAAPVSDFVAPVASPRPFLKHQGTISEEESQSDLVAECNVTVPCTTTVASVDPIHHAESAGVAPEPSVFYGAGSPVSQANMLTPGLELELEELVNTAKKPPPMKVKTDIQTTSDAVITRSVASVACSVEVRPNDFVPVFTTSSNLASYDRTVPSFELKNFQCLAVDLDSETTGGNADADAKALNLSHEGHLDCIYVVTNEGNSVSQPTSQNFKVEDLTVEHSNDMVYEGLNEVTMSALSSDDRVDSSEYHYSPPSFPPPPLPDDFAPYGVFELSMHPNQGPPLSARTVLNNTEELAKQTDSGKPQPPPRRRPSTGTTNVVDDTSFSPLVAGFSTALDDYLSQKVTSPTSWLDQPSRSLSVVGNVSKSEFEPFADLQRLESLPETIEGIDQQNQSLVSMDSDTAYLVLTAEKNDLHEFEKTADDASKGKKTKESAPSVGRSLSADDFKEVSCNIKTGIGNCINKLSHFGHNY